MRCRKKSILCFMFLSLFSYSASSLAMKTEVAAGLEGIPSAASVLSVPTNLSLLVELEDADIEPVVQKRKLSFIERVGYFMDECERNRDFHETKPVADFFRWLYKVLTVGCKSPESIE